MNNVQLLQGDSFEPDYKSTCMSCGRSPTVTVVVDGRVIYNVGLCGACTWGEAAMENPKEWNE